jgi:pilus assembly protein CpaD
MMTRSLPALVLPAALALAACQPGVAEYTKAQAPAHLTLASATSQRAFRFLPGSDRLFPGERARLVRLAARGAIAPSDRVLVAAAGPPALAARRRAAIAQALLQYGIITHPIALAGLPPNRALVEIGRYAVELPPCPNWSKRPYSDFTNQPASNFGCATAVDLGLMAASPADLAGGLPLAAADGEPAVKAVSDYLKGRVQAPAAAGAPTPFAGAGAGGGGAATGGSP